VVVVATRSTDQAITLSVRDGGPGIDEKAVPRLFQRYASISSSRSDSTGLGLFVVRTIVEAHGGSVAVERNTEGGTSFTVTLPRSA
jgi:signal transduction histidine kinase